MADLNPSIVGYAYPWDAGDRLNRVIDRCLPDRMAIAALYHPVRAIDRSAGTSRIIDAWHSARYIPGRAWNGLPLQPPLAEWSAPDAFERISDSLRERGIPVDAWLVLNHLEHVPGMEQWAVVTADGRRLPYTQCPASTAVRSHMRAAVEAAVVDAGADGVVLEAVASLGVHHPVAHDKSRDAYADRRQRTLASWCFCDFCRERRGEPGERLRAVVADALDGRLAPGSHMLRAAARALAQDRVTLGEEALQVALGAARVLGCSRVAVFGCASADAFTPSLPVDAVPQTGVDVVIGSGWGTPEQTDAEFAALSGHRRGLFVNIAQDPAQVASPGELLDRWPVDELHLYHFGLASDEELQPWHHGAARP